MVEAESWDEAIITAEESPLPIDSTYIEDSFRIDEELVEEEKEKLTRTGVLEFGEDERVIRLYEKPKVPPSHWVCPPLYFFQPSVWTELEHFLTSSANHDAPGHFIEYLCRETTVMGFQLRERRLDIGSMEAYRQADEELGGN